MTTPGKDAVVIGAGPAGLAAAAQLQKVGYAVVVIDKADSVGASWSHHYDRLHLLLMLDTKGSDRDIQNNSGFTRRRAQPADSEQALRGCRSIHGGALDAIRLWVGIQTRA